MEFELWNDCGYGDHENGYHSGVSRWLEQEIKYNPLNAALEINHAIDQARKSNRSVQLCNLIHAFRCTDAWKYVDELKWYGFIKGLILFGKGEIQDEAIGLLEQNLTHPAAKEILWNEHSPRARFIEQYTGMIQKEYLETRRTGY